MSDPVPVSPVIALRDAIVSRIAVPADRYKTVRRTLVPQLQPDQLPALTVIVADGESSPDGDGNAGEPRFVEDDTIGIAVTRAVDDTAVAEGAIAAEIEAIKDRLFTDPTFVNFGPGSLFESIVKVKRRWLFPPAGETYFVELRLEITFRGRTSYPPVVRDDYRELAVTYAPSDQVADPGKPLEERSSIERAWVVNTYEDQFP
ncbi:hypothetical protein [Rhodoplanes roseus]|uniref:Phage tail protein n=1 Tax=Rhodoplanes roseus TaxID=29409 RepID=A0A327K8K4_9BRAD|nr:hypothetical protein [Rhodoplanes roseus]RAI34767.1 hypothetical protein CH341_31235 [Rhodoplanes roseus]